MKKKFMIAAAIAALTLVGGYLGKAAADRTYGLSDLQLANAEALAQVEAYTVPCVPEKGCQCVYDIRFADGSFGTAKMNDAKHILHTIH